MERESNDGIQRALNEHKRRALEKRFGARCSFDDADVPPEIIGEWLDYIEEFETQYQGAGRTTVRAFIGSPQFPPSRSLPPADIPRELVRLLALLATNGIEVHMEHPLTAEEQYRFLTEELLDQEIDDIRVPGMTHNFLYGEIHADDRAEAVIEAGHFLHHLFDKNPGACARIAAEKSFSDPAGAPVTRYGLLRALEEFLGGIAAFTRYEMDDLSCVMEGETAVVAFQVTWEGLAAATMRPVSASGTATLRMRKSHPGWEVTGANIPGWAWCGRGKSSE